MSIEVPSLLEPPALGHHAGSGSVAFLRAQQVTTARCSAGSRQKRAWHEEMSKQHDVHLLPLDHTELPVLPLDNQQVVWAPSFYRQLCPRQCKGRPNLLRSTQGVPAKQ